MKLLNILKEVPDDRSYHGKEYALHHIIFFTILALLSNCKSYEDIHRFLKVHFQDLKSIFKLKGRLIPTASAIRRILIRVDIEELEAVLRHYFCKLVDQEESREEGMSHHHLCFDGKMLKGSMSHTKDQRAKGVFNVFSAFSQIVIAHIPLESDKSHEIQAFQKLLEKLDLKDKIVTVDALHCQKKLLN